MSKPKRPKDLLERMKQVAARQAPGGDVQAAAPPPPPAEAQEPAAKKKVRITVDLDPEMHKFLKIYAAERGMRLSELIREWIEGLRESRL